MVSFGFKILKRSNQSHARLGTLKTPHGDIKTPAFVPCATKGTVKALSPEDLEEIGTQCVFVNTYHIVLSPGADVVKKAGGIHRFSRIDRPIISDSGGFQVFSLGRSSANIHLSPVISSKARDLKGISRHLVPRNDSPTVVKITDDGAKFRSPIDGTEYYFTPEFSIEAQKKIGADFIVAFDECTYHGATRKYTELSVNRTHEWAERSLIAAKSNVKSRRSKAHSPQRMYGIIQGGMFKDLRQKSAECVASLPFFGLGIGGAAVGETKRQMRDQVRWVMEIIKGDPRPRHLFGVGENDDIIDCVRMGIDTFDCVIPTRHARMGKLYRVAYNVKRAAQFRQDMIDIFKSKFKKDLSPIDKNCDCYTCTNFTRSYLHHLFKQRELLAYPLATVHNLFVMEELFANIRSQIAAGRL